MKLATNPRLDGLCGEYLLGTLRGRARRRFERALRDEPLVAARLHHWETIMLPRFAQDTETEPSPAVWRRLWRELDLGRYRTPWYRRPVRRFAFPAAAVAALLAAAVLVVLRPPQWLAEPVEIARLSADDRREVVSVTRAPDRRTLRLRASTTAVAPPGRSYELWLLPADGGPPVSLAVLSALEATVELPAAQAGRLSAGAKLAVSVEPAGGSPSGAPTGPVILVGQVQS